MKRAALFLLPAIIIGLAGCDFTEDPDPTQIVVESYLIADEPLPLVRISRTSAANQQYNFTRNAIARATVVVSLMEEDEQTVEKTYSFTENSMEPGVYRPADPEDILPSRLYSLTVNIPGWPEVTASTFVPGRFGLVEANADTIVYQSDEQLELVVTRSSYPNRQSIFVFSTESLDPIFDNLTPFYKDVSSEDDLESLQINESPILNEGNYDINPDGTITIKLPWIAVAFFGPNQLIANALDDNMYDFLRSQSIQQGGSTLGPGEIPNVIDHVEGGIGVFGSLARSRVVVEVVAGATSQ